MATAFLNRVVSAFKNCLPKLLKIMRGRGAIAIGLVLLIVIMMLWLLGAFSQKIGPSANNAQARSAERVELTEVRKLSLPAAESASGTIVPVHESDVASQVMAKVLKVNVSAGKEVKAGDELVVLDDSVLKERLAQAKYSFERETATRDNAKTRLDNIQKAFAQHVATQTELDDAQTAYKTAQASVLAAQKAVDEADATLQYTIIRAPITGTVIDKLIDVGATAKPGQTLLTIYDQMQLIANVPESLVGRLKINQDVQVRIDRLNRICTGQVSEIVPQGDPVSRTFPVKVTGPCDSSIHKGMFARLMIPLDPVDAIMIPRSAVIRVGQLEMVDVAENGRLFRRVVQIGPEAQIEGKKMVQVLSGLRQGQKVALNPAGGAAND